MTSAKKSRTFQEESFTLEENLRVRVVLAVLKNVLLMTFMS